MRFSERTLPGEVKRYLVLVTPVAIIVGWLNLPGHQDVHGWTWVARRFTEPSDRGALSQGMQRSDDLRSMRA